LTGIQTLVYPRRCRHR